MVDRSWETGKGLDALSFSCNSLGQVSAGLGTWYRDKNRDQNRGSWLIYMVQGLAGLIFRGLNLWKIELMCCWPKGKFNGDNGLGRCGLGLGIKTRSSFMQRPLKEGSATELWV
ncbi:hypothetical protein ACOSP7_027589 [Xanthoceras sorbifolium]